jgi:hypothetical protein
MSKSIYAALGDTADTLQAKLNRPLAVQLESAPTAGTASYTDEDGTEREFVLGQAVSYPDSEADSGRSMAWLSSIESDGTRVWIQGGGDGGDVHERITIRLTSNQAQPDADLLGTPIRIWNNTKDQLVYEGEWQGTDLTVKINPLIEYTVSVGDVENYVTPQPQTFTSEMYGIQSATFAYNTQVLTVHIQGVDGETPIATLSYDEVSREVVDGVSVKVPYGKEVTVTPTKVACHTLPESVTYTADTASKEVTLTYVPSKVKITILSNQQDTTDIEGVKATVSWGEESHEVASGETLPVPADETVTIAYPDVEGYQTPESVTLDNTEGGTAEYTVTYATEVVTVIVSCDDNASVDGQEVQVNGESVLYSEPIVRKIPFGTQYTVLCTKKKDYTTPATQIQTAGMVERTITMQYVYCPIVYSTITLNQTITDEQGMITGDVNGEAIQQIRANAHIYLAKKLEDGKIAICQLDDTDSTKFAADGSAATLDGTMGDVFTAYCREKFYTRAVETSTDVWAITFAFGGQPEGDDWQEWGGDDFIGTYEAYVDSSKVYSRSGVASTGSVSQATFNTYASNRGNGYSIVRWHQHCIMAFLFYAQYGRMNCQLVCGYGTNDYQKTTGHTDALGMEDTVAGGNGDSDSVKFFGLENWWGNKYEWIANVNVNSYIWTVNELDGSSRVLPSCPSSGGWISKVQVGKHLDMAPSAVSGSETTGFCDYYGCNSGSRVVRRSHYYSYTYGGVAFANAYVDSSYANADGGSRLAFCGEAADYTNDVSAFKALPVQ